MANGTSKYLSFLILLAIRENFEWEAHCSNLDTAPAAPFAGIMFSGGLRLFPRFPSFSSSSSSYSPFLPAVSIVIPLPPPARATLAPTPPTLPPPLLRGLLFFRRQKHREALATFCTRAAVAQDAPLPAASDSSYLSVRVQCRNRDADALMEALLSFGASSVGKDVAIHVQHADDEVWLTSIFAGNNDVGSCISHAADSINLNYVPKSDVSVAEECDWVKAVQENFHPIEVTTGLWIVPKWRNPPDLQATNIILDPGMAFGTGEHPTTKLCMTLLRSSLRGGESFLDYGTGSGVLGIAAVKMGAALTIGIDIDSQAVTSARENIALNDIDSDKMRVYLVPNKSKSPYFDIRSNTTAEDEALFDKEVKANNKGKFDIIVANILLNNLLDLAEDIVTYAKPGAKVVLSGILTEQAQELKEVYSRYLDDISVSELEGWACLSGHRKMNLVL